MFRIQNQASGKEQDFPNREALLIGLEGEENRCLQLNMTATFHIFHYGRQEEILELMEVTIPSAGGQDVKELLGDFGLKKEESKPFWQQLKGTKKSETIGDKSKYRNSPRLLKGLIWLLPLILSLFSLYLSSKTLQLIKTQPQEKQVQTKQVVMDQKADVFCRYFISSYFSNADSRTDFLSKNIVPTDIKTDKATPVSVLLESQHVNSKTTIVTYVISLRYEDQKISSKRLMLTVKKDKTAKYSYLVVKTPQLTQYP